MSYGHYIKEIGRGAQGARDLSQEDARQLYAAMLDGGVPDLELGALILGLRVKGESLDEMLGFLAATDERTHQFEMPHGRGRPVVLPTYNGARKEANLTPLLALLLQRFGVPVLVHGLLEGYGRVTSAHVFRELGLMPCASHSAVQQAMDGYGVAFVPLNVLSPGLHNLLSLRSRLGLRNSAHSNVAEMFDESERRLPQEDTLTVQHGIVGAYPNAIFALDSNQLSAFVRAVAALRTPADLSALAKQYAIRRTDPRFWPTSDLLHANYLQQQAIEYGILDYSRLENF